MTDRVARAHAAGAQKTHEGPVHGLAGLNDVPINSGLIKGDAKCHAIAAASIIANVWRDNCMRIWDEIFPQYGLASHKGYSTPEHKKALRELGPTPLHRTTYAPVRLASGDLQYDLRYDPGMDG